MKYQDFSSDENLVSSEDTSFIDPSTVKISRLSWLLQSQPIGKDHHSISPSVSI